MILLEMYHNGKLLDSITVCNPLLTTNYKIQVSSLMKELTINYKTILARNGAKPEFLLSGIPSSMNNFTPLSWF
jgi:hypothetical protein